MNMKDDVAGPALVGSIERWKNDTLAMLKYVQNSDEYFRSKPSQRMIDLHKAYGKIIKPNSESLTLKEIKSIIDFIEMRYYYVQVIPN
jgi:hypothetical protein